MPTYEYACRDCGEHLEVVQSFKDDALTVCPNCKGELRKVFSAAGIIFKGSGWHIKDYASTGRSTTAADGAEGASSASDERSGKSSDKDAGTSGKDVGKKPTSAKKDGDRSSGSSSSSSAPSEKSA